MRNTFISDFNALADTKVLRQLSVFQDTQFFENNSSESPFGKTMMGTLHARRGSIPSILSMQTPLQPPIEANEEDVTSSEDREPVEDEEVMPIFKALSHDSWHHEVTAATGEPD